MADEQPSLSIDTDWKKQAQEEKRRLAEEQQKKAAASKAPADPRSPAGPSRGGGAAAAGTRGGRRDLPPVSFGTLVQSIARQVLFYLGDLAPQGGEPMLNLDMAKHHLDTLALLEQKT